MKRFWEKILSLLLLFLVASCISNKIPKSQFHVFTGSSEWTKQEKKLCLLAINNYNNIDSTKIIFKKTNIPCQGQAQPILKTILKKPEKRTYIVKVQDCNPKNPLCFSLLPDSAKIGLIGHELAHIVDYKTKNFLQISATGIKYILSKTYKTQLEYQTDSITIMHNMGAEKLVFYKFITTSDLSDEKYLKNIRRYYMNSKDIIRIMSNSSK
ncbi:MAG: hypothetical protein PHW82_14155 [Bacteroidales bacterium]|nr:hypothetical protein [Bacteroidales bacterium]